MILSMLTLSGCYTVDLQALTPSWLIDRTRILAVEAEVTARPSDPDFEDVGLTEPRPGDIVSFRSLVVHPDYSEFGVTWMGCLPEEADNFGCEIDMEAIEALFEVDPEELTPAELLELMAAAQEAGFWGFEPYFPPALTVPEDVLDDLTEGERQEGLNYFITLSTFPMFEDEEGNLVEVTEEDEPESTEIAYKRMPVSEALTPNHSPAIEHLAVDGFPVEVGQVMHVSPGQPYDLEPMLDETTLEVYRYTTSDGVEEDRVEEPYFTFYATGGDFVANFALYPNSAVQWVAPEASEDEEVTVWVVVRDRRGGMAWWTQPLVVDAP